ncbi:MAG: hypothetical protein KDA78_15975 [Planctomycetaceae bacterium]|nr:hypothetical protein [Planctomycetaceae bacterium]
MTNNIYRKGDLLCCSHIPGPSHNWLGLRLQEDQPSEIILTQMSIRSCETVLDEEKLCAAVDRGVITENANSGSKWFVAEIAYVADDSPRYSVYEMLAVRIVSALNSGHISNSVGNQVTKELYHPEA